jgi:LemA protein
LTFVTMIVIALIALMTTISVHNGIVARRNALRRSWADVLAYQRQKQQVVGKLEEMIAGYRDYEKDLLTHLTQLRASLDRLGPEPDSAALEEAEKHSSALLAGVRVAVEAYPNLKAADAMRDAMGQLVDLQKEVTAALAIFNRNVEIYNTGLEVFPASTINGIVTHARPVAPFTDRAAAAAFDYSPEL